MIANGNAVAGNDTGHGIDLHTHTTASDGLLSPSELVALAGSHGVSVLGVTDHDTLAGLPSAMAAASDAGMTLVPGVELSTTIPGPEIHILGYFVDPDDEGLAAALAQLANDRVDRIANVVRLLNEAGYPIRLDEIMAEAHGGSIGRPHVARALIEVGAASDMNDAFARFLKRGTVGWWPRSPFSAEQAVELLARHGAIPVVAHPFSTGDPEGIVRRLQPVGLRGLEVYYGAYDDAQRGELGRIADSFGLIPTGGSDFHGPKFREGRELGTVEVPGGVWERLFAAAPIFPDLMTADTCFVIVAAGRGERFGQQAKVLAPVAGRPMLAWSIDAALQSPSVAEIVVVAGDHTMTDIRSLAAGFATDRKIDVVPGGATRQESVAAGVAAVGEHTDIVLVHDAARPLVTPDLIERCVQAAHEHGAAIAAIPVTDTLKHVSDRRIERTISRDHLWSAQTPQAFRRADLLGAIAWARSHPALHTDEASLFEAMGQPVTIVEGTAMNMKVTHPEDLVLAGVLLAARHAGLSA